MTPSSSPRHYVEPAQELPVFGEAQVVVVGAGPAGLGAAIGAARNGVDTILVEYFGFPGGTAIAGLMTCVNGWRQQKPPNALQAVKGIGHELVMRLHDMGAATAETSYEQEPFDIARGELPFSVGIESEAFKYAALKMLKEAGVRMLMSCVAAKPYVEDGRVTGVIVESKSGRGVIAAQIVVDCSGDGDIAARAGVPFDNAPNDDPRKMAPALMYRVANVDASKLSKQYHKPGNVFGGIATLWGAGKKGVDGTSLWELSDAEVELRIATWEQFQEIKANDPGYAQALIAETAPKLGIRETRRIHGEYMLTLQDALDAKPMEDVIAISAKPIVNWFGYRFHFSHEGFDVPYRSLVPLNVDGLLLAGRNISQEQPVFQSSRSFAPSTAMGQAAGTAAAMCVEKRIVPREVAIRELQDRLLKQGQQLGRRFEGQG